MSDSTGSERRKDYDELIKVGDAVETPDGALWVVEKAPGALSPISAYRGRDELVFVDKYEATRTVVPAELVTKVADARRVRR